MISMNGIDEHVFERAGQWYFWDETGSEYLGPYKTQEAARNGLLGYAKWLDELDAETSRTKTLDTNEAASVVSGADGRKASKT
jgi:hypothetical protein